MVNSLPLLPLASDIESKVVLKKLVKAGLGGKMGDGKQYMSWIHEKDFINVLFWLINNEKASGAYNIVAPEPIPNAVFMHLMRRLLNSPIGLPSTKWMLEVGAVFLRTETELILKSRRVAPTRLLNEGFKFEFAGIENALKDILKK